MAKMVEAEVIRRQMLRRRHRALVKGYHLFICNTSTCSSTFRPASKRIIQYVLVHLDHSRAVLGRILQVLASSQENVVDDALARLAG